MINLCTLFDSNYLDKAIVMYNSLERNLSEFVLYILCFDNKCYEILDSMALKHIKLAKLEDFETPELLELKKHRTKPEYCWTCTAASIEYFIEKYNLPDCTYIDADLYFFSNPQVLFNEIKKNSADAAIMEHRFGECSKRKLKKLSKSGKYCVEFNYFNSSENGNNILNWWKKNCFKRCSAEYQAATESFPESYGDQKYLEQFPVLFKNVHVIENLGAGVAPWNLRSYKLSPESTPKKILLRYKNENYNIPLVFYHFQNLKFISHEIVNINSQSRDKKLKYIIYYPYLSEIFKIRNELKENYDFELGIRKSYSSKKIKAFIQRYIMPFKLRSFSDLIDVSKIENYSFVL